ncbi:MAG: FAD-dependent monooxygenase, partial [Pyrinomonadaceae bacterium]
SNLNDADTRAYLERVFAPDLGNQQLLSNNSKWINFILVKNDHWTFDNVVLIGDALHTAHFSIGSGTKLALEDSIALAQTFRRHRSVSDALSEFEKTRKPYIAEYQAAAFKSMQWFETARNYMHLRPIELAYSVMRRSGKVDHQELMKRDPGFIAAYEAATS